MSRITRVKSTLTRLANTTAYAQNDLIADNATAGSIVVPSFTIQKRSPFLIRRSILFVNQPTGFTTFAGHVDLWRAAPTFTGGDNAAYAVATGYADWVGHLTSDVSGDNAFADGAAVLLTGGDSYANAGGQPVVIPPISEGTLFWSLKEIDATGFTPVSAGTFTLSLDIETIPV